MNEAVGGEDDRTAELIGISLKVGDFATGFLNEENARGSVPLVEAEFPEAVEAAGGNTSEIERGGTVAANAVRTLGEFAVILKIRAELAIAHGKAGAKQAGRERSDFGDGDFLAVEGGAFAAGGGVKFIVERIEDHGGQERVTLRQSNGNAEAGVAVSEIRGAVERIDVPAKFGSGLLTGAFLGGDGVAGEVLVEAGDDGVLGALVGLGDEVHFVAFVANVERAGKFFHEDLAGFLGNLDGGLEVAFGHGVDCRGVALAWRAMSGE